jgi:hypothetical protein
MRAINVSAANANVLPALRLALAMSGQHLGAAADEQPQPVARAA